MLKRALSPHRFGRGPYAGTENPVVRLEMPMLWTSGPGTLCEPRWCSNELTPQRCGLTGENFVTPRAGEVPAPHSWLPTPGPQGPAACRLGAPVLAGADGSVEPLGVPSSEAGGCFPGQVGGRPRFGSLCRV